MLGIYVMAALTLCFTAILCITFLNYLTRSDRHYYGLIITGLPLSLIVNRLIKIPLINNVAEWTGTPLKLGPDMPPWFLLLILMSAPVFEEAIKVLPVLFLRHILLGNALQALWSGLALGMGFGMGEAAYLAYGIAQSSSYNPTPWYMFTGFLSERLIVTFAHGFLTASAMLGLYYGKRKAWLGYLSAVGLHTLINLGPLLLALKLLPALVSTLGIYAAILFAYVIFQTRMQDLKRITGIESSEIIYFQR